MLIAEQLRHTRVGTREYVKLGRLEVCYVCHRVFFSHARV